MFSLRACAVWAACFAALPSLHADFPLPPESRAQPDVPQGEVLGPFECRSEIFPGTIRDYWLYVPRQYAAAKKACLFIVQDGIERARGWHVPTVLDNLIHRREIPVQIGIFVAPGRVPPATPGRQTRHNRSFEYDSLGDLYPRFLIEELLPKIQQQYNLSDDPNDAVLGGSSSGAIGSFNAAWERPDRFRRVFSCIGSYAALRGGDVFPTLIRKYEPRPIRIFLQDGSKDVNAFGGDWFLINQSMLSALRYSGYDVDHAWSDGGHDDKHGAAVLPQALRFLWRDYPQPVAVPRWPDTFFHVRLLLDGEGWNLFSADHPSIAGLAANAAGELFFSDSLNGRIHRIDLAGSASVFAEDCPGVRGIAFGPEGELYACFQGAQQIVRFPAAGKREILVRGVVGHALTVLSDGRGYVTDPEQHQVWSFDSKGAARVVASGIAKPNGIVASPDQSLIEIVDAEGRCPFSFQIQSDGTLAHGQPYGWLHVPDGATRSNADGLTVDPSGRTYVATEAGLQVLDGEGRLLLILQSPERRRAISHVALGGPQRDELYVACGGKIFRRRIAINVPASRGER